MGSSRGSMEFAFESQRKRKKKKKKRHKRKRNELSDLDDDYFSDDDLEFLSSPVRKRRKKNKKHKKKKKKQELERTDTNESFNIFDEIAISDNDLDIDMHGDKELNNLINSSSLNHIDEQFDGLFTQINAPLPSSDH